jgi:hypothetical protein
MGDALGGGHSVRYGTSYVSRHCIRIGTVLELQLDGGTATRVADAADAADADFIVPHAARTHTSHAQGPRLGARTCLPLLHPTHCSSLSLSLSSRSSGRSAACGKMRPLTSVPYQPSCTGMGCFFFRNCLVLFSETTSRHVHPCPSCFSLRTSPVFPQR